MKSTGKLLSDFARKTINLMTGKPVAGGNEGNALPIVPGYLVREQIGQGGFASVYLVRSIEGERLALKVLHAGSEETAQRASDEAAIAVRHPNVVSVREYGECGGKPYLVTEYCAGGSLATRLDKAPPFEHRKVAVLIRQIADGLATIHRAGYVHRDLSPNNVLFDAEGMPKIADFGLTRPISAMATRVTLSGVVGTPGCVAPERFDGIETDPRSDIYSLGALGYAMLTGSLPYGPTGRTAGRLPPAPIPLRRLRPDLPRSLAVIIHCCLDPEPAYRYQTANDLVNDLGHFLEGGWVIRTRIARGWRQVTWHLRWHKGLYFLLGLALILGGLWTIGRERIIHLEERLRVNATAAALQEKTLREEIERSRDAQAAAAHDNLEQAKVIGRFQATVPGGRRVLDQARGHLAGLATVAERDPGRAAEAAELYRQCGRLAFNLGDVSRAAADYNDALRLAEQAFGADDSSGNHLLLAKALREWGVTRAVQGKVAEARLAWERAAELLKPLATGGPDVRFTLAQLHMVRGNIATTEAGRREHYVAAELLIQELLRELPLNREYRFTLAEILNNRNHLAGGDAVEREDACRRAVGIRRELVAEQPESPEQRAYLAASLNHLGNALQTQGPTRTTEAKSVYEEAQTIYRSLIDAFPGVASNREELKQVESNLARLLGTRAN